MITMKVMHEDDGGEEYGKRFGRALRRLGFKTMHLHDTIENLQNDSIYAFCDLGREYPSLDGLPNIDQTTVVEIPAPRGGSKDTSAWMESIFPIAKPDITFINNRSTLGLYWLKKIYL